MHTSEIKNIIFDLGGVVLNIDYHKTSQAFASYGVSNFDELYSQARQNHLFDRLECGQISPDEFRQELRQLTGLMLSNSAIDEAWNAMLLDLPKDRIEVLIEAKKNYRTFLLSNTNEIHLQHYEAELQRVHGISSLAFLFEKEYFSHVIHRRKPNTDAFLYVIEDAGIKTEESLFIDDSFQHIEGAAKAGLHTLFMDQSRGLQLNMLFDKGKLNTALL